MANTFLGPSANGLRTPLFCIKSPKPNYATLQKCNFQKKLSKKLFVFGQKIVYRSRGEINAFLGVLSSANVTDTFLGSLAEGA